eukprot:CAMPEP_0198237888 /NCGR_PEP_ID=MMETSP1446-20131203/3655_1 /TAXON_ID=1461542 ORGANISM="Unidentified sp, Strain CCMP2111" /NCGR_SAMPLE_ID=MMETSP1446 /ASSEMBLY_ACC=CAM_ASM_001112 /LENGTH=285 /DNA_ID=CAMNT_0043920167 /DNA_START=274 /DNA_END=1131 /DNA_ORIENTATION=+
MARSVEAMCRNPSLSYSGDCTATASSPSPSCSPHCNGYPGLNRCNVPRGRAMRRFVSHNLCASVHSKCSTSNSKSGQLPLVHTLDKRRYSSLSYCKGHNSFEDQSSSVEAGTGWPETFKKISRPDLFRSDSASRHSVRVKFSVQYRCHSRQMLAIAGSMAPLGWSFLSIARNPLTWNKGDVWTVELNLPVGSRVEYKYVLLEEQGWTKQADEAAEGLVPVYRGPQDDPSDPDTDSIVRQMAIVAWQPGPNLVYTVPSEENVRELLDAFHGGSDEGVPLVETIDSW